MSSDPVAPSLTDASLSHLRDVAASAGTTRYEILGELGRGGVGVVYLAEDIELGREVALKVLGAEVPPPMATGGLLHEARVIAHLEHSGIVPIYDVGRLADGRAFYVMKRVVGERLDEWLAHETDSAALLRLFLRICEPVAFAHGAGVIHGDLKPHNIMIGAYGEVLVLDWGVAVRGTPGYMAPEQAAEERTVDRRADVYALGVILARMMRDASLRPRERRVMAAVSAKAAAADVAHRYQSVPTLMRDVADAIAGRRVGAYRESTLERAGRITYNHRAAIVLVAAYLALRAAFILFPAALR